MKNHSTKTTALSLLIGSFLMFITMLLHPGEGGGLTQGHLFAIISHSLAIASVPFSAIGFFGLSALLNEKEFLSRAGLSIMITGLVAAVIAAAFNGLAVPILSWQLSAEMIEQNRVIFDYNRALNHSFDYILVSAMFFSTFIWSIIIIQLKVFPKWLGYLGVGLCTIALIAVIFGFYFLDVGGFRMFIYGWSLWIVATAISMLKLQGTLDS